jgi:hypothetical protein
LKTYVETTRKGDNLQEGCFFPYDVAGLSILMLPLVEFAIRAAIEDVKVFERDKDPWKPVVYSECSSIFVDKFTSWQIK